jgi:hypothetical protein
MSLDIKKCDFTAGPSIVKSTSLMPGMFNQDISFNFLVNVHVTDHKDLEEMLSLFNKAAADFNETWKKEADELTAKK